VQRSRQQQRAVLVVRAVGAVTGIPALLLYPATTPSVALPHRQFAPGTLLLSRSHNGGMPNGPSCCASVSHDERIARVMAFESLATDVAGPVRRGVANVFAGLRRTNP
jgi:hypothetical protein